MAILNKEDAKAILQKIVDLSKAESIEANLGGYSGGNIRYARNTVTTAGEETNTSLSVTSNFGKKSGSASINELDDAALERVVRRSEELAQFSQDNPEFMPPLEAQEFKESKSFKQSTADITPEDRTKIAESSIAPAKASGVIAAGFEEDYNGFEAMMNSNGLFAYNRSTSTDFTVTMRTEDGTGSGYAIHDYNDISKLDTAAASERAIKKAVDSKSAKAVEPGKYTVILEPAASVGLLRNMMWNLGARRADEGRSFMSQKGGGTKLGEQIIDERVNVYQDPFNEANPSRTWTGSGLPVEKMDWIKSGVVENLRYGRFWAKEKGVEPVPFSGRFIMDGGDASTEDMIKDTKRGILVTRLWYIRSVDPQTLLYTGLTRDGTFYIEDGKIQYPVKNFRFNESPIIMLNNLETLGKQYRIDGNMVPVMKIRDFTFTSLSDAV